MSETSGPPAGSSPSYLRFFPYDEPYDHQREAMGTIHEALEAGTDVLFEGATGTGKTLAALAPALEHARETDKTVVITTNVHQQTRQFRREASAIADATDLRAVVFRGKASMCHIDVGYQECQALRDTTRELVETERDQAELERKQRELLEESQAGDSEAGEARGAVMDELEAVEEELADFGDRATCDHYYQNLTADTDDFFAWLYDDVRTPDEIYEYAEGAGMCGYELLKEGVEGVDLVVCNYHHLLDPVIREQFFRWLGRDPEDVIAVFDEAHNVEDAAREHARRTLTETTLEEALDELTGVEDPRREAAENVLSTFRDALATAYGEALSGPESPAERTVGEDWEDLAVDNEEGRDELTLAFLRAYTGPGVEGELDRAVELGRELDERYEDAYRSGETSVRKECQTLQAARFLAAWLEEGDAAGTYPVVSVRREQGSRGGDAAGTGGDGGGPDGAGSEGGRSGGEVYGRAELYTCIPEEVTSSLFGSLHASVLMSATLRPFAVTEDVLGLESPETLAYGPQFPEGRRRTYAVDGPALFASRRDDRRVQETVTEVLEDAARMTPGNTLAFFPSYAEAARYHERVSVGTRYLDEAGTPARELRERFAGDDDGVLFTSLWGTLGEGVSFDGDDARTVVVVGVPYPHLDERMEAVQEAYDGAFEVGEDEAVGATVAGEDAGWHYAVEVPTVRKTRQALGRVVRSPEDFGVRVLLDARYTERAEVEMGEYAVRGAFPPEERAEMVDLDPGKLKFAMLNFYQDMDGYEGDPPAP
ncbi:ATP-dependent DNA helicase [Salinirussus salinus]|uniref:ATP-dependent DNA helicase n=1 Tax=Salinirussus salinus TaxID=1198300 RepID=UPI0022A7EC9D|nr:ATP-dependent DNA helicase [Salinirussus salinus]